MEARARRVIESRRMTTSLLASTSLLAFSNARFATRICSSAGRSKVEAITSPSTDREMSVTSSGRSSMRRAIRMMSG